MAYRFTDSWTDEIFNETSKPEYQNARIRMVDTALIQSDYNFETGEWTVTGDGLLYEGQARVKPVRWGTQTGGESQANASTINAVRVQIPTYTGRVNKGIQVTVLSAPNEALVERVFTITSDLQGSDIATRTFEASADIDAALPEVTP